MIGTSRIARWSSLCLAIVLPHALAAQRDPVFPAVLLRLPASARILAMGNVGIVGRDDDVLFYNPAQLVNARGTSVSAEAFSSSAHDAALSSVTRFFKGGIAVGAEVAQFASAPGVFPVDRPAFFPGGTVPGTDALLVAGIGQTFWNTRLGLSVKYIDERINDTQNSRGVVDLGLARDFFGYQFGLAVQNIGSSFDQVLPFQTSPFESTVLTSTSLPLRTTVGAGRGWPAGPVDLAATAQVSVLRNGFVTPAGGMEMNYSWLDGYSVAVRAGARRPERGEGPVTAGLGFTMDRLSIDYALDSSIDGRIANRLGLRIR